MQFDREYLRPFLTYRSYTRGDQLVEQYDELTALAEKERNQKKTSRSDNLLENAWFIFEINLLSKELFK